VIGRRIGATPTWGQGGQRRPRHSTRIVHHVGWHGAAGLKTGELNARRKSDDFGFKTPAKIRVARARLARHAPCTCSASIVQTHLTVFQGGPATPPDRLCTDELVEKRTVRLGSAPETPGRIMQRGLQEHTSWTPRDTSALVTGGMARKGKSVQPPPRFLARRRRQTWHVGRNNGRRRRPAARAAKANRKRPAACGRCLMVVRGLRQKQRGATPRACRRAAAQLGVAGNLLVQLAGAGRWNGKTVRDHGRWIGIGMGRGLRGCMWHNAIYYHSLLARVWAPDEKPRRDGGRDSS